MELTDQETLDLMAAHALDGWLASFAGFTCPPPVTAAKEAYDYAAAMMAERARRDERGVVTEESNG